MSDFRPDESAPVGEKLPHPTLPDRWADGTVRPGNRAAMKHGAYSVQTRADFEAAKNDIVAGLLADGGGPDAFSVAKRHLAERYAELVLLGDGFASYLSNGGPLTTTGRQKRALAGYFAAVDRQLKIAQVLGLERKARSISGLDAKEYLRQQAERGRA